MPLLKDYRLKAKLNLVFVCALVQHKERELRLYALPLYNYDKSFLRMHVLSFYTPLTKSARSNDRNLLSSLF
jgi:hypothetical protein